MTEANLQTEWAALLFKSLADAGVREIVISPGSRSTPFVVAAVREPRLTRHTIVDERAAAFFALGQARITNRPTVLVCTSGTALAHYLPAIIEANLTGIPMIVLSADRPHELQDCNAPQTIDQVKLFAGHVRHFFDLVPHDSDEAFRALRRTAAQAVLTTAWPQPGAVHLNARARKPLEPVIATQPGELRLAERARAVGNDTFVVARPPGSEPAAAAVAETITCIRAAKRGVIVLGPAACQQRDAREAVWALARATGFPIACEASSQLRFVAKPSGVHYIDGFVLLLHSRAFHASRVFDIALQIGVPLTSAPEEVNPGLPRIVFAQHGWPDPHRNTRVMLFGDVSASCNALVAALRESPPATAPSFHAEIECLDAIAWDTAARELAATERLTEAAAVRTLMDRVPDGSVLVLGNSLSIRIVDLYVRAMDRDLRVLSQRGASGIDGLVAGAAGAAAASQRPTALVIGDVSLLHDLTSLGLAARARTPLIIFLLHNGGGRIFDQLPIVNVPGIETSIVEHATTPHDTDFAAAATLYGVRYALARSGAEVGAAVDGAYAHAGCTLIEIRVEPNGATALTRRVIKALETAVVPFLPGARA